jgi:histidinol-phosphatase (PHP family)
LSRTQDLLAAHAEIDYIVGSVHHVGGIPIDFDRSTWLRAVHAAGRGETGGSMMSVSPDGSVTEIPVDPSIPQLQLTHTPSLTESRPFIQAYLDQQFHMIRTLRPEVVGHLDLFRLWTPELDVRCSELNEGEEGIWDKIERNVREVVAYGGLFELNTAAFRKGWHTAYPSRAISEVGSSCLDWAKVHTD